MKDNPCNGCEERYPACHSTCPRYAKAKVEHEKETAYTKQKCESTWLQFNKPQE